MADGPMSDERLAEIRRLASRAEVSMMASSDVAVRDLLAEVDRLRAALDTASYLIERLEEHAELPIAHPLNTAIDDWLRSIGV